VKRAVFALLLLAGAAHAEGDDLGRTPLHRAAISGDAAAVGDLLAKGAARDARDGAGRTPLLAAWLWGKEEAARALEHAGARLTPADVAALAVPGGAFEIASLPPVARGDRSEKYDNAAFAIARGAGDDLDGALLQFRRAIAADPGNLPMRVSLAETLMDNGQPALAIAVGASLREAGCLPCIEAVRTLDRAFSRDAEIPAPLQKAYDAVFVDPHGKPTAATAPSEALWKAFVDGADLGPIVAAKVRVRVFTQISTDQPLKTTLDKTMNPKALAAWQKKFASVDRHRTNIWWCDAECCEYRPEDPRGPSKQYLVEVCVDAKGKVKSFVWSGY